MTEEVKYCAVCGDVAIAKNFGALSCQSCKPFFRRNANKINLSKCKTGGKCLIDVQTRKKCRKCRLDKCISVGMRSDYILSDEQREYRNKFIEQNRNKKCLTKLVGNFESLDITQTSSSSSNAVDSDQIDYMFTGNGMSTDQFTEDNISQAEELILMTEMVGNSLDTFKLVADKDSGQSLTVYRPISANKNTFTDLEFYRLMQLTSEMRDLHFKISVDSHVIDNNTIQDIVKNNGIFFENQSMKLIRTVKKMSAFDSMSDNDRLAMVKNSCVDIVCMRTVQLYDKHNEAWKIPICEDNVTVYSIDSLREISSEGHALYKNNWNYIFNECHLDSVVIDLLTAIALFNPNQPNLENRCAIDAQQRFFIRLLKNYLLLKYQTENESMLSRMANILLCCHVMTQLEKRYFFENFSQLSGPFLKELFDIKN